MSCSKRHPVPRSTQIRHGEVHRRSEAILYLCRLSGIFLSSGGSRLFLTGSIFPCGSVFLAPLIRCHFPVHNVTEIELYSPVWSLLSLHREENLSCRFLSSDFLKKRLCLRSPATGMEAVRNFDRIVFIFRICQNLFKRIQNICLCNGF